MNNIEVNAVIGLVPEDTKRMVIAYATYAFILLSHRVSLLFISGFPGAITLRRIARNLVFFVPILFFGFPALNLINWGTIAGMFLGLGFLAFRKSEIKLNLSSEYIALLPSISKESKFRNTFLLFFGAVAQEYLYRGVLLPITTSFVGVGAILIVAGLFTYEHVLHYGSRQLFDKYDYLNQFLLGLGLGMVFFISHSLAGCMLGHIIYNLPGMIQTLRSKSL